MRPSKNQFSQRELTETFRYYILNFSFLQLKKFKQERHQERWSNFFCVLQIFCYSSQVLRNPFHTSYNGRHYFTRWKSIKASLDITYRWIPRTSNLQDQLQASHPGLKMWLRHMLLIVLAFRSSAAFWPFSEDAKNGKIQFVPVSCLPFSCPL